MSKRGQEATSGDGSAVAKPKPMVPRPLNLVSHSPWSEKNSSQNLVYLVNRVNADERTAVEIATGKLVQTASKSEVGYSQVSRQENAPVTDGNLCMEQLQNQCDQRTLSNSNRPRQFVQGATPRPEFQNMKYTNHQYMTKIFHFQQKSWELQQVTQLSQWKH